MMWMLMVALTPTDAGLMESMVYEYHATEMECEQHKRQLETLAPHSNAHLFCIDGRQLIDLRMGKVM